MHSCKSHIFQTSNAVRLFSKCYIWKVCKIELSSISICNHKKEIFKRTQKDSLKVLLLLKVESLTERDFFCSNSEISNISLEFFNKRFITYKVAKFFGLSKINQLVLTYLITRQEKMTYLSVSFRDLKELRQHLEMRILSGKSSYLFQGFSSHIYTIQVQPFVNKYR